MICTHCRTDTVVWRGDILAPRGVQCTRCDSWNCAAPMDAPAERKADADLFQGDECPECRMGWMELRIENCSCHIAPPCSACVDAPLVCDACDYTVERQD